MASSLDRSRSVTQSIRDDFLTCHVCHEVFTDPRILPCLHTYCFQCICSHVDSVQVEGRAAACPECREPLPEVVSSLKCNFFVNGLTEVVKEKSVQNVPCTSCLCRGKEAAAKVKCLDCGDYLCSTCSDGHNASSLTWKHEKIPLEHIKQGTYDEKLRQLQKIKCFRHQEKEVEYYCESCSRSVCLACVLLDHRDHKCKTISEAVCDKRATITSLTEKLREKLVVITNEEDAARDMLQAMPRRQRRERLEIEKTAQQEIAKINAKKEAALKGIARKTRAEQMKYDEQLEALQLRKSLVSSCVNFSDSILKKGKDEEVLMLEAIVTDRLLHLQGLGKVNEQTSQEMYVDKHGDESLTTGRKDDMSLQFGGTDNSKFKTEVIHAKKQATTTYADRQQGDNTLTRSHSLGALGLDLENESKTVVEKRNTFSAKCAGDAMDPDIKGMVYSPKIGLILSDRRNSKIKIMSKTGDLVREITTGGFQPFAVAVAGDIIGVISENYLLLFTSKGSLKHKIMLTEKKPNENSRFTFSLAASEAIGFVVGNIGMNGRLVFYTMHGKFARYLYCSVQAPLAALSVNHAGDLVLSEWGRGRIRVMAREGKLRLCTEESSLKPNGTCTSRDGTIFVADYRRGGVLLYSPKGVCYHFHSTRADGLYHPTHVAIDENGSLYTSESDGIICVYKIHRKDSDSGRVFYSRDLSYF